MNIKNVLHLYETFQEEQEICKGGELQSTTDHMPQWHEKWVNSGGDRKGDKLTCAVNTISTDLMCLQFVQIIYGTPIHLYVKKMRERGRF